MNALLQTISNYLQHATLTAPFLDALPKSVAILAVAAGLCLLLPRAAAATRHWIWFLAVASVPCLLLLACLPHSWHRPLWSVSTGVNSGNEFSLTLNLAPARGAVNSIAPVPPAGTVAAATSRGFSGSSQSIAARFSTTWLAVAFMIWFCGALLGLIAVLLGHVRLRRLARRGLPLQTPDWALLLRQARDTLRLRRPVSLWQSVDNSMPLTWGWWRPVVLLPAEAEQWPAQRRRVVLLHELAHVKRWDCLTQTIAQIVRALYWINPLVWLATRRMCIERERACDDLVLNGGCKASDYATQLVAIAQTYRHMPQVAAIAMARSSQIKGRIAAIVDASRARRARPLTAMAILVFMGAFIWSVGGSSPGTSRDETAASNLRQQQIARLRAFAQAKEKQSRELAAKAGEQITPEFQRFFAAAIKGDWRTVTNRWEYYHLHHHQYEKGTNATIDSLVTPYWQPVIELCMAYTHVVHCEPKYTALFADGIISSIPAGSIYFGGTDPGRCVPTAFVKSHAEADPFFILTQNALADGTYLEYLRAMYGGRIYIPTGEDSAKCFQDYVADAQRRMQEHKLKPGEDVKMVDGKVQVSGQVAVMSINGLITKVIFDRNPDRGFYVEESFPLDWMYPYLEPHGLIMKLNRQPLAQLPEEVIARDHEYWRKVVGDMLGDWLGDKTTVRNIADFVDRVYVRKNLKGFPADTGLIAQMPMSKIVEWENRTGVRKDLKGFTGDPRFVQSGFATASFSKLRSSIAGVYAWRLSTNAPPEYQPKSEADRQALLAEADLAFRQAFALCPYSPEALFRYVSLLLQSSRFDDALLIAQTFLKVDPQNKQARGLLENIKSYKAQHARAGAAANNAASLEEQARAGALTGAQAEALAEKLANDKAQALYHCQPFRSGTPAHWVQGSWVWHDLRAQGTLDLEATVKFAADGTHPDVRVNLLDSRSNRAGLPF
jgi:beta-lactamase regulating signal transducer with metallopeptidase domain